MRTRKPDTQLGLFDAPPAPVAPVMEPRGSMKPVPLPPGVSDDTGGPLSALEAGRVIVGQSITVGGRWWYDGRVTCREHRDEWLAGAGFRMTIYAGTNKDQDCGACAICQARVVGEPR